MKWILVFGLILILGHFQFFTSSLDDLSLLGFPLWLYAFGGIHLIFIYFLWCYSKTDLMNEL